MIANELISDEIPTVKTSDTGLDVTHWMEEYKVSHLPIVNKHEYIGLISDTDIMDSDITDEELSKYKLSLMRPYVLQGQHIYDVIKMFSNLKLTVLPVLDTNENYIGSIPIIALLQEFSTIAATHEPGGIIVLEMNEHDYSLSQIAQIVEGNDGKILGCYVNSTEDSTKIAVTVKVNKEEISGILQTFHRYNYNVRASFHQREFNDDVKNRFDSFMNYLNM